MGKDARSHTSLQPAGVELHLGRKAAVRAPGAAPGHMRLLEIRLCKGSTKGQVGRPPKPLVGGQKLME